MRRVATDAGEAACSKVSQRRQPWVGSLARFLPSVVCASVCGFPSYRRPSPSRMPGRINLDGSTPSLWLSAQLRLTRFGHRGWEQRCREICSSQPSRKEAMQPPDPHDGCHQPTGMSEQELPARPEHCLATIQEEAKPRNLADAGAKETVVSSHAAEASRTASPSPVYAERDATNLEPSPGPWQAALVVFCSELRFMPHVLSSHIMLPSLHQELSEEALLERDAGVKKVLADHATVAVACDPAAKAAEAECFCMWDSEDDDRGGPRLSRVVSNLKC